MKLFRVIAGIVLTVFITGPFFTSCGKKESYKPIRLIPRSVLFGNPERMNPQISPNGNMISYIAPSRGALNVWVATISKDDMRPVTSDTIRGIYDYFWNADNKHIIFLNDKLGNEIYNLFMTNIETGETENLTPNDTVTTRIIYYNMNFPDEILISMNKDNPELFDAYRLYLATGDIEKLVKNTGSVFSWIADADMQIKAAHLVNNEGGYSLVVREDEQSEWKVLIDWGPEDALLSAGIGFTRDGQSMFIIDSRGVNAARLIKMDIYSGKMDVLAEDPQYDIGGIMTHPKTYEVQAVSFEKERQEIKILDESIREDIEILQKLHPGDLSLTGRDQTDDNWLVAFSSDDGPVAYYAFDRSTNDATLLFHRRPKLNDYSFAKMEPMSFNARDGLTINGYITYPSGLDKKNLPLILMPHGGPWIRDTWGFDPEVQWLANRGYVVLQVNYRGSSGYGKDFLNAGNREWGRKSHYDLLDAADWAIDEGIADPARIAILGYSFGGYQALIGAAFNPDKFICAVAAAAPSNLISYINSIPPKWTTMLAIIYARMGNPKTDEELLKSQSPLFKADQIRIPILIAHGAQDPRVQQSEADQIVEVLKNNEVEHKYLLFEDEGHGFLRPENRLEYYATVEEFLAKHLGGRYEPAP